MANKVKYECPVCGNLTLDERPPGTYQICPVCFWEDDPVQFDDPNYEGGANRVSLNQAKTNYQLFSAIDRGFLKFVRKPLYSEIKKLD